MQRQEGRTPAGEPLGQGRLIDVPDHRRGVVSPRNFAHVELGRLPINLQIRERMHQDLHAPSIGCSGLPTEHAPVGPTCRRALRVIPKKTSNPIHHQHRRVTAAKTHRSLQVEENPSHGPDCIKSHAQECALQQLAFGAQRVTLRRLTRRHSSCVDQEVLEPHMSAQSRRHRSVPVIRQFESQWLGARRQATQARRRAGLVPSQPGGTQGTPRLDPQFLLSPLGGICTRSIPEMPRFVKR